MPKANFITLHCKRPALSRIISFLTTAQLFRQIHISSWQASLAYSFYSHTATSRPSTRTFSASVPQQKQA